MRVAALLGLLAALPAHAGDAVTPAQARVNVVQALPPDIAKGIPAGGDLQTVLQRLTPEQKAAAIRSLTAKEGALGKDPATLNVIGQAYAGLGKVKEAKQAAQAALERNRNDPEALRLMGWVQSQERLAGREGGGGAFGDTGGPGGGGQSPRAASVQANLNQLEQRIQGLFRRGQGSDEFKSTMQDARGLSVAELKAAGIEFQRAPADQRDAVIIQRTDSGGFTVSLRADALQSGGDTEARAAAQVANGVRQAQTYRDHSVPVAWALVKARGWLTGAKTHQELAPNDLKFDPNNPSDMNLAAQRKILSVKGEKLSEEPSSYGDNTSTGVLSMMGAVAGRMDMEGLFSYFIRSTKRDNGG